MSPAGAVGCRQWGPQWGCQGEQQVGLYRICMGFIHSSAGGGMACMDKCGRCQDLKPSLLTLHLWKHHPQHSILVENGAKQGETMVALETPICSMDLPWRAKIPAGSASVSLLAGRGGPPRPQAAVQLCLPAQHFPPWAHLFQAAVAELKLHLQGNQELWGGCWALAAKPQGSRKAQSARLQPFAKASRSQKDASRA